ncbi:MAG: hypothetical protein V4622_10400 [Bacteroidota bacterium]
MKLIFLFFLALFSFCLSAQGNSTKKTQFLDSNVSFSNSLRYNKLDFYFSHGIQIEKEKLKNEFGLGFGINKTIFQQRINPEFYYMLSSNFRNDNLIDFQLVASFHLNFYNTNRNKREIHFFNELLTGFKLEMGKKLKFHFQAEIGLFSESFHSDFYSKNLFLLDFTYSAKMGISYAF